MATGLRLGANAKFYRNTGVYATPVWDIINNIHDFNVPMKWTEAPVTTRGAGGTIQVEPTLKDISFEFDMLEDMDDTDFTTLLAAFHAKTKLDVFACSGAYNAAGENYVRGEVKITDMSKGEPLDGVDTYKVVMKPCYSTNAWQYGVVA